MASNETIVRSAHGVVLKRRETGFGEPSAGRYVLCSPDRGIQQFDDYAEADAAWLCESGGRPYSSEAACIPRTASA